MWCWLGRSKGDDGPQIDGADVRRPAMSSIGATPSSDPLTAVRSRLMRADEFLTAGCWAEAEATLRDAIATLGRAPGAPPPPVRGGLTPNQGARVQAHVEACLDQ